MNKIELSMGNCDLCSHFDFCLIHWGIECKRQGGNKIPRFKTSPAEERKRNSKKQTARQNPMQLKKQTSEITEPIRTKAVRW